MTRIELLRRLIEKETDPVKLKELNDELIKVIQEEAAAEAEKKAQEQIDAKVKEALTKATTIPQGGQGSGLEVTGNDTYKGYRLKQQVEGMILSPKTPTLLRDVYKSNPMRAERLAKTMLDIWTNAITDPARLKAYNEGTTTAGGHLVPTEDRYDILMYIRDKGYSLDLCDRVSMSSDSMTVPKKGTTNVSVNITAEETDATPTSGTFDQVTLTAKRFDATTLVTNEFMNDNAMPGGIVAWLLDEFSEALALKIDSAVFLCPGDPVSGIFVSYGYSEVFNTGSTAFSELLEANIRNLVGKIPARYHTPNSKWIVGHDIKWQYIYGLKDTQGRPLFVPSMTEREPDRIWGRAAISPTQVPAVADSAASKVMMVYGDPKGFIIGERLTNISLFIDPYTSSKSYQTAIHFFTRWAFNNALNKYWGAMVTGAAG